MRDKVPQETAAEIFIFIIYVRSLKQSKIRKRADPTRAGEYSV